MRILANIFAGAVSIAATAVAVWWFWWPEPEAKSEARIDAATECEATVSRALSVIDMLRAQRVAGISKEMLVEDMEIAPPAGLSPEQVARGRAQIRNLVEMVYTMSLDELDLLDTPEVRAVMIGSASKSAVGNYQ